MDEFMSGVMILKFFLYNFLHNFLKLSKLVFSSTFQLLLLPHRTESE